VNFDLTIESKSQIGCQILAYLVAHPDAQDTLEGIVEWWLLERTIKFETARVKEALAELSSKGLILEEKGTDSRTLYRINKDRYEEIRKIFKPEATDY
jgi:hypothetical protein